MPIDGEWRSTIADHYCRSVKNASRNLYSSGAQVPQRVIICFKLHAGMVAVLQMLKDLQSSNSDTTYNSIITILTQTMPTECALIVSGTLTLRLCGL